MRVLLTGGAGFIGSHLAERLIERGEELTVLDNFSAFYDPTIKERNIEIIRRRGDFRLARVDILDRERLEGVFEQGRFEAVIHLAAWAGVGPSLLQPSLYSDVNVTGTVNLLEMTRRHQVRSFVFGSSSSVYGISNRIPFHEDDPVCHPISPYAASKRAGELAAFVYHHNYGIEISCLRFFTVYGPRQRPEMAIHRFTRQIDRGEEVAVYDAERSERDYTYVDDIAFGVLGALDRASGFQIYNLGNSRGVGLLDLVALIEQALGKKARIRLLPARPGEVRLTRADLTRARRDLGYNPSTPIEQGIPRFVEWYLGSEPCS